MSYLNQSFANLSPSFNCDLLNELNLGLKKISISSALLGYGTMWILKNKSGWIVDYLPLFSKGLNLKTKLQMRLDRASFNCVDIYVGK